MRSINKVIKAQKINMGGIVLDQALPHRGIDQLSPFLLIHHWADTLPGGQNQKNVGVGPHPHRGFAPVTLIFKGSVHHRDSQGFEDIISAGGTQWMDSGSGIVHSERPGKDLAEKGGDFEIIQFWVNSPAKYKMHPATYQPLKSDKMKVVKEDTGNVEIGVVAGTYKNVDSTINTMTPLLILRIDIKAGGKTTIPIPQNFNALVYQLDGSVVVNGGEDVEDKDMILFNNDGESISIQAKADSRLILLSGEPINESLATYGPFVMNTQQEIMTAINDFQSGKMGRLIENFD